MFTGVAVAYFRVLTTTREVLVCKEYKVINFLQNNYIKNEDK